jgi:chemotaxis signal transduction protein/HPt (histidine-containing phosphotransfer) domain-containing protein
MGDFDDMIPEYVTESTELLTAVESGFLALEEGTADDETINTIFRAIHSIKGGAGFVGVTKIEHLAHKMEDLLGLIRNKDMEATPQVAVALLRSMDVLRSLFDNIGDMEGIDTQAAMESLSQVLEGGVGDPTIQEIQTTSSTSKNSELPNFVVSNYNLKNALQQGNVFYLKMDLGKVEERGLNPMELFSELLSMGEILDAGINIPPEGQDYENIILSVDVLYSTVLESDLLCAALHLEEGEYRLLSEKDFQMIEPVAAAVPPSPPPAAPPAPAPPPAPVSAPAPAAAKLEEPPRLPEKDQDYLTFRLGGEIYCVDILSVQEIISLPHIARLPRSRQDVLGVMNLRGMVVPVFDLRIRFGVPTTRTSTSVVVVMRQNEKIMGGIVDEVRDVVHIRAQEIQPPPIFSEEDDSGLSRVFCLEGLIKLKEDIVIILNVDRVFAIGENF